MSHLNRLETFNTSRESIFMNPDYDLNGMRVLVDNSGSILSKGREREVKLAVSAIAALTGHVGKLKIGRPRGGTSFADVVTEVSSEMSDGEKLVVITDGDDTTSKRHWSYSDPQGIHSEGYYDRKRKALLDHLESTTKAEIFLVGIGTEVKDLIRMAAEPGRRIQCSHIVESTSENDIAKIVKTTISASARDVDVSGRIIELSAEGCEFAELNEEEQARFDTARPMISYNHEFLTSSEIRSIIEESMNAVPSTAVDEKLSRTAILWFLGEMAHRNDSMAGALLGSRKQSVFEDPIPMNGAWNRYLNQVLSMLVNKILVRDAEQDEVTYDINGVKFKYFKVRPYKLQKVSADAIDEIKNDSGWACNLSSLKRRPAGKRKRDQ